MRKSAILPARSFAWCRGRPAGGGLVLIQDLALIRFLTLNPIGPDRFRHALKTHTGRPVLCLTWCGIRWRGRDRRKLSCNDEKIPRLTGRSCGGLPGIGRTLPSRHLRHPIVRCVTGEPGRSVRAPAHWSMTCHNGGFGLFQKLPSIQWLLPPAL